MRPRSKPIPSVNELVEAVPRPGLALPQSQPSFLLKPFGFMGKGQSVTEWGTIRGMAYEGRGGDKPKP